MAACRPAARRSPAASYMTTNEKIRAIAQAAKVIMTSMRQRRLNLRVLAETGGMPSSHAAIVMGMTTAVGKYAGVSSAAFAIALIFSFVVMYDAAGLRRAAGRQAAILNRLVEDLVHMRGMQEQRLRELLGHTPVEVLVGALLGIVVGLIL
jgi:acid phosphatase family membrane protein YuiD